MFSFPRKPQTTVKGEAVETLLSSQKLIFPCSTHLAFVSETIIQTALQKDHSSEFNQ